MAINVADVVTQYGSYYLNHGQNQADLLKKIHRPSVTAGYFNLRPTKETILRTGTLEMTRVLQPFQKAFTKIGGMTFKANPIDLFNLKIDVEEYPDEIVDTWVGFLEGEGIDREQWPFVRWMIEVYLVDQAKEDFEMNEVWGGVYAAPTAGTAGAAGTSMNGIKKQFTDHAARINTISMGAIPSADKDVCSYIEEWFEQIEVEHRKRITNIFVNESLELRYRKGKDDKYNTNYAQETSGNTLKYFPNAKVIGLPSMGTDGTIWGTLGQNMLRPLKKQEFSNLKIESSKRLVSVFTDWWTVCSFARWESVFKNDL